MRLILRYKFLKKNIDHSFLTIDTLDSDLGILFQVLKDAKTTSPYDEATDLRSYSGMMVNEIQKLSTKGEDYFSDFEDKIDLDVSKIENGKHLKKQFLNLGIEISGAFHMATEFDKGVKSLWNGIVKV